MAKSAHGAPSLLLLLLASIAICAPEVIAEGKLKVGISIPLSGVVAPMGVAFERGMTLFKERHPEEAEKIELVVDDHRYDGKSAAASCNKLSSVDKVDLLVVWGNTPSEICAPIAERLKTPSLMVSMNADAKDRKFVVTIGPRIESAVQILVDYFKKLGAKHPAAVTIDIGSAVKGVTMTRDGLGGGMQVKLVPGTETDFKSIIAALKQNGTDALLLFLIPEQATTFAKQAVDLNFKVPLVGGDIFADENFQRGFTKLLPSLAFVYGAVDDSFVNTVRERFGGSSYVFETATGFTTLQLLARLSDYAQRNRSDNILDGIRHLNLTGTPTTLTLQDDPEFGLHIEMQDRLYEAAHS